MSVEIEKDFSWTAEWNVEANNIYDVLGKVKTKICIQIIKIISEIIALWL